MSPGDERLLVQMARSKEGIALELFLVEQRSAARSRLETLNDPHALAQAQGVAQGLTQLLKQMEIWRGE
jgi:hypothetical protein